MKNYELIYDKSAEHSDSGWQNEVLPIGNGYMGMCIFGGVSTEYLQYNDKTLWAGGPSPKRPNYFGGNIKDSVKSLKGIQKALENGKDLAVKTLKNKLVGISDGYGNYLNFGEIAIEFGHFGEGDYERSLNINNAVAKVEYNINGVSHAREYFASYPDRVTVSKITTCGGELACKITNSIAQDGASVKTENNSIIATGKVADNELEYYAKLSVVTDGELVLAGESLVLTKATYCELYLATGTNYKANYPIYRGESPVETVDKIIADAITLGYDVLKARHIADYKSYFDRAEFDLGAEESELYTDKLVENYKLSTSGNDARYYEELLYAYGRYLIIASSRGGSLPANLQGVWNNSNSPAWGSDYHLNVNLQMCYWHVYETNLHEIALPMIDYMDSMRAPGRVTAKEYHGIESTKENPENGWVCHTQCTPFGWTCPGWAFEWGWSPAASSWMMQNCYDYYLYTEDKAMLHDKIYPMMKENAKFWLQNLVYNKVQDRWVSSPSFSPEHGPITVGNTYEQEMVWILFNDTVHAAEILNDDAEFIAKLREIMPKLSPLHVGKWGQVKEWYEEDEWFKRTWYKKFAYSRHNCQYKHRHASHLIGLYPALHITPETPELLEAAKVSLHDRGLGAIGNDSGWGKANKINMWARVKEGEEAYNLVVSLLRHNIKSNLWDAHPPFQMDGNCGYTAGVTEMLLFSDGKRIELLPALPKAWSSGSVKGICARGNYTVGMTWNNGLVTEFTAHSDTKDTVIMRVNGKEMSIKTNLLITL